MKIVKKLIWKMCINKSIHIYGTYYSTNRKVIAAILKHLQISNENVFVWGAGLKGVAFLKIFDEDKKYVKGIYDIDCSRIGTKLATEHLILDYKNSENHNRQTILLMNNNYEAEVAGMIRKEKICARLINIDSIILGKLNKDQVLEMYGEYL